MEVFILSRKDEHRLAVRLPKTDRSDQFLSHLDFLAYPALVVPANDKPAARDGNPYGAIGPHCQPVGTAFVLAGINKDLSRSSRHPLTDRVPKYDPPIGVGMVKEFVTGISPQTIGHENVMRQDFHFTVNSEAIETSGKSIGA